MSEQGRDDILGGRARIPSHVVYRAFESETLLLNLQSSQYHGLNETGSRMLELLEETDGDLSEAVEWLAREQGVEVDEIRQPLVDFCVRLRDRGLIEVEPGDGT